MPPSPWGCNIMIAVDGAEWHRIEDCMNDRRDCIDTIYLFDAIVNWARIHKRHDPFITDSLTGEQSVDKAVAIAAAQLFSDLPDDF